MKGVRILLKQLTSVPVALLLVAVLLAGCSSSPRQPGGKDASVDGATQRQFNDAVGLMKAGQYQQAIPKLEGLTQSRPDLAGPWTNLGIAQARVGRTDDAINALKKAVEADPAAPAAHTELGMAYRAAGEFESARKAYLEAIRIDPGDADAHRNLGILFELYLQKPDRALSHYRQYQALQAVEDAEVGKWILDLERRVQSAQAKSEVNR